MKMVACFRMAVQKLRADWLLWLALALYVTGALCLSHTGLFWDSISIFAPATFFYDNHWATLSLPPGYVTDNLPLNLLLSAWWYVFGRDLLATHVLFILFGCGVVVNIYKICRLAEIPDNARKYVFLLAVSDTALVTQLLVPMFDGVMLFFVLWGFRAILEKRPVGLAVAMVFLAMMRTRGVLFCGGLAVCHWICHRQFKTTVLCFLPAFCVAVGLWAVQWFLQRHIFGVGTDSPWHLTTRYGMFQHGMSFGRFMLENNRFFLWSVGIACVLYGGKPCWRQEKWRWSIQMFAVIFILCVLITVPFENPYGPRYFLPVFVLLPWLTAVVAFNALPFRSARWYCILLTIGLWGGHLWRYPETQFVSWDTTLAHLPYYELRSSMRNYMREHDIHPSEVRSFFPMVKSDYMIDLRGSKEKFSETDENVSYVLYSNLFNMCGKENAGIGNDWVLQRRFEKGGVCLDLYKVPTLP